MTASTKLKTISESLDNSVAGTDNTFEPSDLDNVPPIPSVLEAYAKVFMITSRFGGSRCIITETKPESAISNFPPSRYYFTIAKDWRSVLMYYGTKMLILAHFLFFASRCLIRLILPGEGDQNVGMSLIGTSSYLFALAMIWGIYVCTHFRMERICAFFTRFNELDKVIFEKGKKREKLAPIFKT